MALENELRIGNWVGVDGGINPVMGITTQDGDAGIITERLGKISFTRIGEVEPFNASNLIWLELFGFKEIADKAIGKLHWCGRWILWINDKDYLEVRITKNYVFVKGSMLRSMKIQYLHQLQNLFFALTNTEMKYVGHNP